jgi:prepilin-type N-terminal cleavage/methylation domain-containing protein
MKGFSLIELMLAVALCAVILAAIYALYSQGSSTWHTTDVNVEVIQDARKAMSTMTKELANSADSVCSISTTLAANDTIAFQAPNISAAGNLTWGNQVSYYRGGTDNRQLIRTETGLSNGVLCNNLVGLSFSKESTAAGTAVNINLQTSKATVRGNILSAALMDKVKLRNQ